MNITSGNKTIWAMVASAAALLLSGCADWTRPESVDYGVKSPELSAEYLAGLRSFKGSEHKVCIVTIDATADQPVSRVQHLDAMPDSADYICVRGAWEGLHPSVAGEIPQVREQKGTKVLCDVDYATINDAWNAIENSKEEGEPAGTAEEFAAFVSEHVKLQLDVADRYGFDGIMVSYTGTRSGNGEAGQEAFMEAVIGWRSTHADALMMFSGNTLNVIEDKDRPYRTSLFGECRYVIIPAGTVYSSGEFSRVMKRYCNMDNVRDRVILEVNVPSETYPQQENYDPQPVEAARWVLESEKEYVKAGICIDNTNDDYLSTGTFTTIRKAIQVMNTTPAEEDVE